MAECFVVRKVRICPEGRPVVLARKGKRRKRRQVGAVEWTADVHRAAIYVGQRVGNRPYNRTSYCSRLRPEISQSKLDAIVADLRQAQVGSTSLTRTSGRGIWGDAAEPTSIYEFYFEPSDRESSSRAWARNMKKLAEQIADYTCQDAVILQLRMPGVDRAYGINKLTSKGERKRRGLPVRRR